MVEFEFNEESRAELQRQLGEDKFSAGIHVPPAGIHVPRHCSEEHAIESVKDQLTHVGAEPNDDAVKQIVREARQG